MIEQRFFRVSGLERSCHERKIGSFYGGEKWRRCAFKVLLYVALVLVIITMFSHNAIIYLLAIASLVYSYFRMMSRNVSKRYYENQQYLRMTDKVRDKFRGASAKAKYQKSKAVYEREQKRSTRSTIVRPASRRSACQRARAKITITCPKCKMEFVKRT